MNSFKVQIKLQDEIVGQVEVQALEPERAIEMVADLITIEVLREKHENQRTGDLPETPKEV